jgi:hypothetical protein
MTRATPVIAAAGSALLIIAIATAAIRGADEGLPSADPTTPAATTPADPDPTTPEPTPEPTDEPEPTEGPTDPDPTEDPTDPDPTDPDPTDPDPTTDPTDPDDGDVDDDVDDMPETGGGALAVLGVGLAAAAAMTGRRRA